MRDLLLGGAGFIMRDLLPGGASFTMRDLLIWMDKPIYGILNDSGVLLNMRIM